MGKHFLFLPAIGHLLSKNIQYKKKSTLKAFDYVSGSDALPERGISIHLNYRAALWALMT